MDAGAGCFAETCSVLCPPWRGRGEAVFCCSGGVQGRSLWQAELASSLARVPPSRTGRSALPCPPLPHQCTATCPKPLCPNRLGFGEARRLLGGSRRGRPPGRRAAAWADRALLGGMDWRPQGHLPSGGRGCHSVCGAPGVPRAQEPSSSLRRVAADPGTPQGVISMYPSRG